MPGPFAPRSPEQRAARQAARTAPGLVGGKVASVAPVQTRRAQDRTATPAAGGDTDHAGSGANSVQVGPSSTATGDRSIALGSGVDASANEATVVGWNSIGDHQFGTAIGADTWAKGDYSTVLGAESTARGARSTCIGYSGTVNAADVCLVRADKLEVESSSGAFLQTCVILTDSGGTRWKIGVDTSGNPIGLGPA